MAWQPIGYHPSDMAPIASFSGRHLIIECLGIGPVCDEAGLKQLMQQAAAAGGARELSCHMHTFGEGAGVTGVMLLAESHITVHTWPERNYAAFDVFMCGSCNADAAAEVIARAWPRGRLEIRAIDRPVSTSSGEQQ